LGVAGVAARGEQWPNLVLEKVGGDNVNEFMASLDLKDTLSLRKIGGGGDSGLSDVCGVWMERYFLGDGAVLYDV